MRALLFAVFLIASCSAPPVAAPPDITHASIEEAIPSLLEEVCVANLGSRDAIARMAKEGAWAPVRESVVRAWDDKGIPSMHRKIWRVRGGDTPIFVETGVSGGSTGTWLCRIAFKGGAPEVFSDRFEELRREVAEIRQPNVPNIGWTNLGYFSGGSHEPWSVLNFSYVDEANAPPLRVVELTAQAKGSPPDILSSLIPFD